MNKNIYETLNSLKEEKYKAFSSSLIPDAKENYILGVRTPKLRALAKALTVDDFSDSAFDFHEEKLLYAFVLSDLKDYNQCIKLTESFLEHIDNWAICDSFRPKSFKKNKESLIIKIYEWLESSHPYTVRFAIGMLMSHYLDEDFKEEYLIRVAQIRSSEYYVNMMIAWYFATALAKRYSTTVTFFINNSLGTWVHNKAIQKAVESYRVSAEEKELLKTLKRKVK